ncbi:hypothetical protein [Lagierella sp.]|uniref:hypothetical protein n=1 Tax=Lagierella sp. TaxID=2849657 RepID=UPI002635951A|nr:hypothetical protein [Lagierella sp.]
MKKKFIMTIAIIICGISMISCSKKAMNNNDIKNRTKVEEHKHHHDHDEHEHHHDHEDGHHHHDIAGKEIETEIGKRTIIKGLDELDESKNNGPFNFKINAVQLSKLEPKEEKLKEFNNEKEIYFVTINLFMEHQSQGLDKIDFTQSKVIGSNNVEYKANADKSDPISGEFNGNAMDQGNLVFFVDNSFEKDSKMVFQIPQAMDEEGNAVGNVVEFEIKFPE